MREKIPSFSSVWNWGSRKSGFEDHISWNTTPCCQHLQGARCHELQRSPKTAQSSWTSLTVEAARATKMSLTKLHTSENSWGSIKTENYTAQKLKQPYISPNQMSLTPLFTIHYIWKFGLHLNRERKIIQAVISFECLSEDTQQPRCYTLQSEGLL